MRGKFGNIEREFSWRRLLSLNPWINDTEGIKATLLMPFAKVTTKDIGGDWSVGLNNISRQQSYAEKIVYSEERSSCRQSTDFGQSVVREWLASRKSYECFESPQFSYQPRKVKIRTELAACDNYEDTHPLITDYIETNLDAHFPRPPTSDEEDDDQYDRLCYPSVFLD
jgi:hypothetical protein